MYIERLKKLSKKQCVQFAVFCAEQALPVFEKEYPDDSRPRAAICAAKKWLENPHITNPNAAYAAVRSTNVYANATTVAAARSAAHAACAAAKCWGNIHGTAHANYAAADAAHVGADTAAIEKYLRELEACTTND